MRDAAFRRAYELHTTGRLAEAATVYQEMLGADPRDADALHQLGVLANQIGQPEVAVDLIGRALAERPDDPVFHGNLGEALRRLNHHELAISEFRIALAMLPNLPELHGNLALALLATGDRAGARASFEHALTLRPDFIDANYNLATMLLDLGEPATALAHYDRVLAAQPGHGPALTNRGRALMALGRSTAAEASFAAALAVLPEDPTAHVHHGVALLAVGRTDGAIYAFENALALAPEHPEALRNLGDALQALGQLEPAIAHYRRALAVRPRDGAALNNLGNAELRRGDTAAAAAVFDRGLAAVPHDPELLNSRGNLRAQQGRLAEARADFEAALAIVPERHEIRSNLLCQLNYDPAVTEAELEAAHRDYGRRVTAPPAPPHANPRDPERPLRIGYVSPDLGRHPVGWFLRAVLAAHDRTRVLATCYSGRLVEDDLTRELRASAAAWRATVGVTDDELVALIRDDGIDVLIDLAGHTAGNRLPAFARRPAPVQASWIGYFNTTGLPAIDAVLVDEATVPPADDGRFVETVVRLPTGRLCYGAPDYAPPVAPAPHARSGAVTFGSFNNLAKLTPAVIALWAAVLGAVPAARLVLKWHSLADADERRRLLDGFAAHGIAPARLDLRGYSPHDALLAEYGDIDIALDPFPFCGGLTSCEALWMGVPVITLPGRRPVSRQTLALLTQLDLTELAARDADDYVAIAARLAADRARLAALRTDLRARIAASPLGDATRFTRAVEDALRALWRGWCARTA